MSEFVRVTEPKGKVHWVNLAHVRHLTVRPAIKDAPVVTQVHIDNWVIEKELVVVETPEEILGQRS